MITVSDVAVRQARQCGFNGDVLNRIKGIAVAAVPTNHEIGNLAYGDFVLMARGSHIVAFTMIGPQIEDRRAVHECKLCRGLTIIKTKGPGGIVTRACPRAYNHDAPLCDTFRSKL